MTRAFRTIPDDGKPLRVVQVGAGAMGRVWLNAIGSEAQVELVGLVDLDEATASRVASDLPGHGVVVGTDVLEVARRAGAQAVIDVTVPAAHHSVTTAALFAGLPVLGEKPAAADLAAGLSLAAAAELTGELFMVSQNRRYVPTLWQFRAALPRIGPIGILTTEFFKAPHFGGFRDEMGHPLLLDMAVHQFDSARFLLADDPVAVYCEEYNPLWSWYRGDAGCTAVFEFSGGTRYVFTGSWCSPGLETSWNGSWRASGAGGSARWDGENSPTVEEMSPAQPADGPNLPGTDVGGSLREFVQALRTGGTPMGEVHDNLVSLTMVEAAANSSGTRARVTLADTLHAAVDMAIHREVREDVATVLRSWTGDPRFAATSGST